MARKRYSDEGALKILREIDVHLHDGLDVVSVCASVAHVLSVTLRQLKSTKEVYRKLMRSMRIDAIVNQWSTIRTPTAL